jgi:outer membrane receptor protein involved in Fe transport
MSLPEANVELDWDRTLPAVNSTIRMAVFAQRTSNILTNLYEAAAIGDGLLVGGVEEQRAVAANVGYSSAVGGEIGSRGHSPSGFPWNASYSYITISDHLSINQNGIFSPQNFQQGTPAHGVVLGGGYSVGRWRSQFVDYRADLAQVTLQLVTVPNYVLFNARAGYRLTDNITVALSAQQFNMSRLLVSAAPPGLRR